MQIDLKRIKSAIEKKQPPKKKLLTPERTLEVADSLEDNNLKPSDVERYRNLAFAKMNQAQKDKYHIARGAKLKENLANELNELFDEMETKYKGTVVNGIKKNKK